MDTLYYKKNKLFQYIQNFLIFTGILSVFLFLNFGKSFAKYDYKVIESKQDYASQLSKSIINTKFDGRKQIVQNYCDFALSHPFLSEEKTVPVFYDASQSTFLYLLCNHIGDYEKVFDKELVKNIKKKSLDDFHLICKTRQDGIWQPKGCIPGCESQDPTMLGCDFSMILPKIIKPIINDISNAGLVLAYGMTDNKKEIDELTDDMGFRYFDFPLYNSKFTEYPETFNTAKKFLKKIRKIINKTEVINMQDIMQLGKKLPSSQCDKTDKFFVNNILKFPTKKYNINLCAFNDAIIFNQKRPMLEGVLDIMQNEMYWYQLFVDYYSHILKNNNHLIPFVITENPVKEMNKTIEEANKIQKDSIIVHNALSTTIRSITNAQATFWIHIGFMMYYEEATKFRNALAKVYTPIHQLYYKLRNVQMEK